MVDQLCQGYHWTLDEAMRLTMPQIIMLSHASSVNMKRAGLNTTVSVDQDDEDPTVMVGGISKQLSKLTPEEKDLYYSDWS